MHASQLTHTCCRCSAWQAYSNRPRLWKDGQRWAEIERSTVQNAVHGDKLTWDDAAAAVVTVSFPHPGELVRKGNLTLVRSDLTTALSS